MKRLVVLVAVVAGLSAVAGASASSRLDVNGTVAEIVETDPGFSTFVSLARSAGIEELMADEKAYVELFAPTNAAFRRLEKAVPGVTKALKDPRNKALLVAVVKSHITRQHLSSRSLIEIGDRAGRIQTLLSGSDGKLRVGTKAFTFTLADSAGLNTATGTELDIAADNGGIQVIDKVLVPKSVATALKKAGILT